MRRVSTWTMMMGFFTAVLFACNSSPSKTSERPELSDSTAFLQLRLVDREISSLMKQTRKIKKALEEDDSERKITRMLSKADEQLEVVEGKFKELDTEILEKLNQEHFDKYLRIQDYIRDETEEIQEFKKVTSHDER